MISFFAIPCPVLALILGTHNAPMLQRTECATVSPSSYTGFRLEASAHKRTCLVRSIAEAL